MWTITAPGKKEKLNGKHPTQKPLALLERLIEAATDKNDLVIDPFSGSGTTGVACKNLGRKYIGIEIDKNYNALARKRLKEIS
mgnify:FL=1